MRRGDPSRQGRCGRTGRACAPAALLAAALAPCPLAAQVQDFALMRSEVLDTMAVQNPADMDFGDITPGTANGRVVMTPNGSGPAASCAGNNGILHTGACRAAHFQGTGGFIFNLRITTPAGNQITLTGPAGATMLLHDFTFAKGSPLMLGGSLTNPQYFVIGGNFSVYVGGTLDVARNQRPGRYNGTFTLDFTYN